MLTVLSSVCYASYYACILRNVLVLWFISVAIIVVAYAANAVMAHYRVGLVDTYLIDKLSSVKDGKLDKVIIHF